MSRSHRHTPIIGNIVANSDRATKDQAHHRLRVATRTALAADRDPPGVKGIGEPNESMKDGKKHFNKRLHPELMRK